jgi:hypothetical protein
MKFMPVPNSHQRWNMPTQPVQRVGWYETRGGELVEIRYTTPNWVWGVYQDQRRSDTWLRHGARKWGPPAQEDLVAYYGPNFSNVRRTYV